MKKIPSIFVIAFLLLIGHANAQLEMAETGGWITIGALKTLGAVKAKMEYKANGKDTTYNLFMRDFTDRGKNADTHYFSVSFRNTGDAFGQFYTLLKSFFLEENKGNQYTKTFRLGSDMVNLMHYMLITGKGVRLTTKEGYINLSERDVEKLFWKR